MSKGVWSNTRWRTASVLELMRNYGAVGIKRADLVKLVMEKCACSYAQANRATHRAVFRYPGVLKYQYGHDGREVVTYHDQR